MSADAPPINASTKDEVSAWSPFRHAAYAVLWTATIVSNIGTWMYNAASGLADDRSRSEPVHCRDGADRDDVADVPVSAASRRACRYRRSAGFLIWVEVATHGRVLVLLDACRSGLISGADIRKEMAAANVTVLTSSEADKPSREDEKWQQHGAFAKALLDALSSSLSNLADYKRRGVFWRN